MATKTANVTASIHPNIKEQVEVILDRLGILVSAFIDMTYRQVVMRWCTISISVYADL